MRTLKFIDMTLRQAAVLRGRELSFKEKLEIARSLDRLRADTIELAPISGSKADQLANRTIASMVATRISAAVDISVGNIEETWESVRPAKKPKLNILAPVSTVQMEYACHKKAPAMLELISGQVKKARFYSEHVEFSAVDATRAEPDFLCQAVQAAIDAGADKITLCDTAGVMLPDEFGAFVAAVKEKVPALAEMEFYVEINDTISMAVGCAAAAVREGATGVKCTAIDVGYPTMEELAAFVQVKGNELDVTTQVRVTELHRAVGQLARILQPEEEETSRFSNVGLEDITSVCLDSSDPISEVVSVIHQMGYDLSEEDNAKSGNVITATANILLEKDGEEMRGVGIGDGPIDAAFQAIEQIIGHHYELDDFQIQTVTEGRDAMGSALVKLRSGGRVYSGNGISTDIIGASIRAYLSALNKIVYEEA